MRDYKFAAVTCNAKRPLLVLPPAMGRKSPAGPTRAPYELN